MNHDPSERSGGFRSLQGSRCAGWWMCEPAHFKKSKDDASDQARYTKHQDQALLPRKAGHKSGNQRQGRRRHNRQHFLESKRKVYLTVCP